MNYKIPLKINVLNIIEILGVLRVNFVLFVVKQEFFLTTKGTKVYTKSTKVFIDNFPIITTHTCKEYIVKNYGRLIPFHILLSFAFPAISFTTRHDVLSIV